MKSPNLCAAFLVCVVAASACKSDDKKAGEDKTPGAGGATASAGSNTAGAASGTVVVLPSGIKATVPTGAKPLPSKSGGLRFMVRHSGTLLDVNDVPGECAATLKKEKASLEQNRQNAELQKLSRTVAITSKKVGTRDALHVVSENRVPREVAENRPAHPVESLMICVGKATVIVTVSQRSGSVSPEGQALHLAVARSLVAP